MITLYRSLPACNVREQRLLAFGLEFVDKPKGEKPAQESEKPMTPEERAKVQKERDDKRAQRVQNEEQNRKTENPDAVLDRNLQADNGKEKMIQNLAKLLIAQNADPDEKKFNDIVEKAFQDTGINIIIERGNGTRVSREIVIKNKTTGKPVVSFDYNFGAKPGLSKVQWSQDK